MDRQLQERLSKKFADMKIDERIDLLLTFYADNKYSSRMTSEQKQLIDHLFGGYYPLLIEDDGQSHIEDIEDRQYHNERNYKSETLDIMVSDKLVTTFKTWLW
ncbi:MAG: hypothetical protein IPN22_12570 [Bacteroidetes bacterium]|nr:hypothetical protein [Bacteroidota bacterium]